MQRRGLVTYSSAQSAASLKVAQEELRTLGVCLDFFHHSNSARLPRRPNLLASFVFEEARILQAVRSGSYSFAIIPAPSARTSFLSHFLRLARERHVDVYMYWHGCGWIISKVRDLIGENDFQEYLRLLEAYQPQHLVASPSTFTDAHRAVRLQEAHCVWNATPRPRSDEPPDDDPPLIVNVASVQLRKAPELFVDVAQYVCARHPTARFVWVGGSSDAGLRGYLRSAGVQERVVFMGWSDHPGSWLRRSSALLFTSRSEAFGLVVSEAMAAGRTVIAFAGTGAADALDDSGIIVERYDTVKAAEAILDILEDPVRDRINIHARRRYQQMFTPDAFAKRLAGVLEGRTDLLLTGAKRG